MKGLSEIPGIVWSTVGVFVAVISFFTAFIRKSSQAFFILMLVVGVGMFIYGIYKIKNMRKKTEEELSKKVTESKFRTDDFDVPEQKPQPQSSGPFGQSVSPNRNVQPPQRNYPQHTQQQRTYPQHQYAHQGNPHHNYTHRTTTHVKRFCPRCGAPLKLRNKTLNN